MMNIENLAEHALAQNMASRQASNIEKTSLWRRLWEIIQHRCARYNIVGVRRQGRLCIRDTKTGTHYLIFAYEIYRNKHLLKRLTPSCRRYIEQIARVEMRSGANKDNGKPGSSPTESTMNLPGGR